MKASKAERLARIAARQRKCPTCKTMVVSALHGAASGSCPAWGDEGRTTDTAIEAAARDRRANSRGVR